MRSDLETALSSAEVISWGDENAPGCWYFRFAVPNDAKTAYRIAFEADKGDAVLLVTDKGHLYEAQLDDARPATYPFSGNPFGRTLMTDCIHEFGHAVIAQRLGVRVDEIVFPNIDLTVDPPRSWGIANTRTQELTSDDGPIILKISVAGVVAEALFHGREDRLRNATRLFGSDQEYYGDLHKAIYACGDRFTVGLFDATVLEVTEWLRPSMSRLVERAESAINDARQQVSTQLVVDWAEYAKYFPTT